MDYGTFVDDISVTLGFTHDDSLFYRDNILMNTTYCENLLVTQSMAKDLDFGGDALSASHRLEVVVVPLTYNESPTDTNWPYLYFDLPSEVYDLPFDGGISFIRYHRPSLPVNCRPSIAGVTFTQATMGSLSGLYGTSYQNPREDRPYYARYRVGVTDRVAVFGVSPLITKLLVGVYYAPRFETMQFSDSMRIDPHRLNDLKRLVLNMSVWPLGIPQERLKNDGRDMEPNQVVNTRPLVGVNDPILNSDTPQ